jgi:hypothetical protein
MRRKVQRIWSKEIRSWIIEIIGRTKANSRTKRGPRKTGGSEGNGQPRKERKRKE